ncbi:MAG: hypothetical protein FJ104_17770 [Deltaproteobacteria bacterium]|nr:hypothetical protein [Deltaproteobacteria bacterium]
MVATSAAVALAHLGLGVTFALRNSHYLGDDVLAFEAARRLPLLEHLVAPIDVHLVPLHRLVTFLIHRPGRTRSPGPAIATTPRARSCS